MGLSGTLQGKGRFFIDRGGNFEATRTPRRNWVKRLGAQFRWMVRRAEAAWEMELNFRRKGFSQQFWNQKTGDGGFAV
jgi:hypothetical protein